MSLFWLGWMLLAYEGPVAFDKVTGLAPVKSDSEFFMEDPLSFDFDDAGNYYVLDGGAKVIFTWDKQGRYKGTIGKPGQGPGEFVFSGRGPASGYVNAVGDTLYVMDSPKHEIMTFKGGKFVKALPIRLSRGGISSFAVIGPNKFLVQWRRMGDDKMMNEVVYLDGEGKTLETMMSQVDDSFQMGARGGSGGRPNFKIKAFNPGLVTSYNRATGQLLFGQSNEPLFTVQEKGGQKRVVKVPLVREEVTKADQEEFNQRFQNGNFKPQVEFPSQKPFYTHLISLGEKGFLVYHQSPYNREIKGVHLDKTGKAMGRFSMKCGQTGGLLASRGRVLRVSLDEDDDLRLEELKVR